MCCVQRDLVGGSISNADDGEDTEEEIGSDEEFDSDDESASNPLLQKQF